MCTYYLFLTKENQTLFNCDMSMRMCITGFQAGTCSSYLFCGSNKYIWVGYCKISLDLDGVDLKISEDLKKNNVNL